MARLTLPKDTDNGGAVGHAFRVSSRDQDPKSQVEAAVARGISPANIHIETASGARDERPVLSKLFAALEKGDVLVTFRLDRLGRSVHLVKVLEDLEIRGVGFETLDGVSTRGATGKLVLHILGSVAQFERQLLIERTMAGLQAARAGGRTGGPRPRPERRVMCEARAASAETTRQAAIQRA
jgi:DNA invertase Pin-like site-specific DNA recombinase